MQTFDYVSGSLTRRRASFLLLGVISLALLPSFLDHVYFFMSSHVNVIQGNWTLVALNIGVFMLFAIPLALGWRWRVNWQSASLGVYAAFIVSLFVEMYGVPLSIYLTSSLVPTGSRAGLGAAGGQEFLFTFTFLGQPMALTPWKTVGAGIIVLGAALIVVGWATLYRTDEELVTSGVYRYSRHPQYLGFTLFLFGWFVHWPSLLTLVMFPILAYFYYRLSKVEEEEVMESMDDKDAYREYIEETPRFL